MDDKLLRDEIGGIGSRLKALESSAFTTGGQLTAEQKSKFEQQIRGSNDIMNLADVNLVDNAEGLIDTIYISNSITKGSTENAEASETLTPLLGQDAYETVEVYASLDVTHKFLRRNIEKDNFADTIIDMVIEAMGNDLGMLCVQGDTDSADELLGTLDGFVKLTDSAHLLDAGGGEIEFEIFAGAFSRFPDAKRRRLRKKLHWLGHSRLWTDWEIEMADRVLSPGDSALGGSAAQPLGIPSAVLDELPCDLAADYTSAVPATHTGTVAGPYNIVLDSNDSLKIDVDDDVGGAVTVVVPPGFYRGVELASTLEALVNASALVNDVVITVTPTGYLKIESVTADADSEIDIQVTGAADDIIDTIGWTEDVYTGAVAGANTVPMGTHLFLTDPLNFWIGILDSLRIFWEFKPRYNRWQLTIYSELACHVRDIDAVIRVDNLRLKDFA